MKMNTTRNVMKGVGGVLAVCSAVSMIAGSKKSDAACGTKKTIKKTAHKITDVIDAVTSFM